MSIEVVRTIMGGMVIEFGTKLKMLTGFFDHGVINRKKNRLMYQSVGNSPDSFRYRNVIPGGMIIGICFECIVKRVKRGIGQSGNHMAVCKANGAETVQSQNGDNQQEQVSGGRSGSSGKIILKIEKQSIKNGIFKV